MNMTPRSAQERKLFNDVLDASIRTVAAYELPLSFATIGDRFAGAIETGERDPMRLKQLILQPELGEAS